MSEFNYKYSLICFLLKLELELSKMASHIASKMLVGIKLFEYVLDNKVGMSSFQTYFVRAIVILEQMLFKKC